MPDALSGCESASTVTIQSIEVSLENTDVVKLPVCESDMGDEVLIVREVRKTRAMKLQEEHRDFNKSTMARLRGHITERSHLKFSFFQVDHNQRVSERIWGQTRQGILDAVKDDISCSTKLLQNLTAGNKVICRISPQNCGTKDVSKEDMER